VLTVVWTVNPDLAARWVARSVFAASRLAASVAAAATRDAVPPSTQPPFIPSLRSDDLKPSYGSFSGSGSIPSPRPATSTVRS